MAICFILRITKTCHKTSSQYNSQYDKFLFFTDLYRNRFFFLTLKLEIDKNIISVWNFMTLEDFSTHKKHSYITTIDKKRWK